MSRYSVTLNVPVTLGRPRMFSEHNMLVPTYFDPDHRKCNAIEPGLFMFTSIYVDDVNLLPDQVVEDGYAMARGHGGIKFFSKPCRHSLHIIGEYTGKIPEAMMPGSTFILCVTFTGDRARVQPHKVPS